MENEEIRKAVRERYGKIASKNNSETTAVASCCEPQSSQAVQEIAGIPVKNACGCSPQENASKAIGYTDEQLGAIPDGANLGLGCGNPTALAELKKGETVVDLGAGAGIDCFLASLAVGPSGKVIGVDMTPEMIEKARANAKKNGDSNTEFRLGEIEHLPVADSSVDAIISNCVINLSPDKEQVFKEAFRVLKAGGRIMVSDMVLLRELPGFIKSSVEAYAGCVAGASMKDDYLTKLRQTGFKDVSVISQKEFPMESIETDPTVQELMEKYQITTETLADVVKSVVSVHVRAVKPA